MYSVNSQATEPPRTTGRASCLLWRLDVQSGVHSVTAKTLPPATEKCLVLYLEGAEGLTIQSRLA